MVDKSGKESTDFVGKNCALCSTYPPHNHLEFDGEYLCRSCALEVYQKVKREIIKKGLI